MMSFCKNSLHAFLGIYHRDIQNPPSSSPPDLNSIAAGGDRRKPTNILESTSVKPPKKVPTREGSGSLDEIVGGGGLLVHGLSSCTESLGFESSEQMEQCINDEAIINSNKSTISASNKSKERSRFREDLNKKFPPVLSSLRRNDRDQHSTSLSFLKPVRENGRLVLTKVTITKPEVFRASREDGRLRLQLIHQNSDKSAEVKEEAKKAEVKEEVKEEVREEVRKEAQEKKKMILSTSSGGGGEGMARCHEMVNRRNKQQHRLHNHLHLQQQQLWNQQCVTSR